MSLVAAVENLADFEQAIQNLQAGLRLRVIDQASNEYAIAALDFDAAGMNLLLHIDTTKPL